MDQSKKRARVGEAGESAAERRRRQQQQQAEDVAAEVAEALEKGTGGVGEEEPWQRPPGVFEFPWHKCRNGLGVNAIGTGWELRDVFFRSLVDGGAANIGIPGDRLLSPNESWRALFEAVDKWLADGDVDPLWRSVLQGHKPAA